MLILTHSKTTRSWTPTVSATRPSKPNAAFSEAQQDAAVAGYEKYRTFIDNGQWVDIKMGK